MGRWDRWCSTRLRIATTSLICSGSPSSRLGLRIQLRLSWLMNIRERLYSGPILLFSQTTQATSSSLIAEPSAKAYLQTAVVVSLSSTCSSRALDPLPFAASALPQAWPSAKISAWSTSPKQARIASFASINPKKASIIWGNCSLYAVFSTSSTDDTAPPHSHPPITIS